MLYELRPSDNFTQFAEEILYNILKRLQVSKGRQINIALSGGQTPLPILNLLKKRELNWSQFSFYMVDERTVPIEDSSSNYGTISAAFLEEISSQSFSMVQKDQSFKVSAQNYSRLIEKNVPKSDQTGFPRFDVVLLGMGEDGHTASLFPGTKALSEETEIVVINDIPQINTQRITLTYPVLLSADEIVVLVKGQNKKTIVTEIFTKNPPNYPISHIVKNHSNINWILG